MTQTEQIWEHLQRAPITPIEALNQYGCFRLAARIDDLKKEHPEIRRRMVGRNGKKWCEYYLQHDENGQMRMAI